MRHSTLPRLTREVCDRRGGPRVTEAQLMAVVFAINSGATQLHYITGATVCVDDRNGTKVQRIKFAAQYGTEYALCGIDGKLIELMGESSFTYLLLRLVTCQEDCTNADWCNHVQILNDAANDTCEELRHLLRIVGTAA